MRALIGIVHQRLVGPFEIEGADQRFAQLRMAEFLAPRIDEPALRAGRRLVGQDLAFHPVVADRRKIVARRPDARGELLAKQIALAGESFESDVAITIKLVPYRVEIVLPDADGQTAAPPVPHALVFDIAPDLETPHFVGARPERHVERRFVEWARRVVGARQDRQAGDEQRHVAAAFLGKAHDHHVLVGRFDRGQVAQELADDRMALRLEGGEREHDVLGADAAAVVEARLGAQEKAIGQAVGGNGDRTGGEPVHRVRLVGCARHQRREGELHPLRAVALEDEGVERVEGQEILVELPRRSHLGEGSALRRVRIDIVEMAEVRRVFQVAERRHAVAFGVLVSRMRKAAEFGSGKRRQAGCGHEQSVAARQPRPALRGREGGGERRKLRTG